MSLEFSKGLTKCHEEGSPWELEGLWGVHTSLHLYRYPLALCPRLLPGLGQRHSCCSPLSPSCPHVCFLYRSVSCSVLSSSLCSCFSLKLPWALSHSAFALATPFRPGCSFLPSSPWYCLPILQVSVSCLSSGISLGALTRSGPYSRLSQAPCLFFPAHLRGCDYVCVGVHIWLETISPTGLNSMKTDICLLLPTPACLVLVVVPDA